MGGTKARSGLFIGLLVTLALGLAAAFMVMAKGALDSVEQSAHDRATTLGRTVVRSIKGVIRHGPDQEGRVYGILDEVSSDPEVLGVGIVDPSGKALVVRGDPLPDLDNIAPGQAVTTEQGTLVLVLHFDVPSGCMAPGSCQCGAGACTCGADTPWGIPPGSFGLVLVMDATSTSRVTATIVAQAALAIVLFAGLVVVAFLLMRSTRAREQLTRDVALEQQRRRSLESLGLLAAGLAHEIRNPLASIRGFAQLMHEQTDDDESRERSALMMAEMDRVSERLTEFLGFARKRKLDVKDVDLAALVRHAAFMLEPDAGEAGIVIDVDGAGGRPIVEGDEHQLEELVLNLLLNSIQASAAGGRITVSVSEGTAGVSMIIRDRGSGIRPDDLPHMFEPYFTTRERGSGLGLAISRRIAEDHGAVLTLDNAPGGGAVARLVFGHERRTGG